MTSISISTRNRPRSWPLPIDAAWRCAIGVYVAGRLGLSLWSLAVLLLFPMVVRNLDLFGTPVLAIFNMQSSAREVYSRKVGGSTLDFRLGDPGTINDNETGGKWKIANGQAVNGPYSGESLGQSPFAVEEVFPYHAVKPEPNPLLAVWQRFDTIWYQKIAESGYTSDEASVYFPLYPGLVRMLNVPLGDTLLAGIVVSNLALIGALYFLYRLAEESVGENAARRAVAYFAIFPTAFFLFAAYTESTFMLFSLAALHSARHKQWALAVLLAALAALTRLQGLVLFVPLVYLLWREWKDQRARLPWFFARIALLILIPVSSFAFLMLTNLTLLDTYQAKLSAQFVFPWQNIWACLSVLSSNRGTSVDALNLGVVVVMAVLVLIVWRRYPREFGLFALVMLLVPLFRMTTSQPLVSMSRYALAVFPVFMVLGEAGQSQWINRLVLYTSLPLLLYLSAQFFLWGWVG